MTLEGRGSGPKKATSLYSTTPRREGTWEKGFHTPGKKFGSSRGMVCCSARRPKRQLFVKKDHVTGANFLSATEGEPFNPSPNAVLILTLRMGFGHLRIAHAVASWLDDGREAYVYDLLATDSPESESLKRYEWIYSKFSKVASASGGPIEWASTSS